LAAFLDQELRQVWAMERATGAPVFLGVGQAAEKRTIAKTEWRCPVPDCEDFRITTAGSPRRRDHFRHLGHGAGHSDGEGVFHLQAKSMLAAWARAKYPTLTVREEQTVKHTESRMHRRADVMVTWPDQRRTAIEVEYKAFSPEAWSAKDSQYESAGVGRIWLFGHLRRHLAQPRRPSDWPEDQVDDRLELRDLTRAVAEAGQWLIFVNPIERSVATAIVDGWGLDEARRRPNWWVDPASVGPRRPCGMFGKQARLVIDSLDDCEVDPHLGFVTPAISWVTEQRELVLQAAEADRTLALRRPEENQRFASPVVRGSLELVGSPREQAAEQARVYAQRRRDEWLASDRYKNFARAYPPKLAEIVLDHATYFYPGIYFEPQQMRYLIYRDLIHGRRGSTLTFLDVRNAVLRFPGFQYDTRDSQPLRHVNRAVASFLWRLRSCGLLDFESEGYFIHGDIAIRSDLDHIQRRMATESAERGPSPSEPPFRPALATAKEAVPEPTPTAKPTDEHKQVRLARRARLERLRSSHRLPCGHLPTSTEHQNACLDERTPTSHMPRSSSQKPARDGQPNEPRVAEEPAATSRRLTCQRCHEPLDPVLATAGRHLLCF
jgi:hypothetical protein